MDRARLKALPGLYRLVQLNRYVQFQPRLALARLADGVAGRWHASQELPPARLRYRVHGALDRASFARMGRVVAQDVREVLRSVGRDLASFACILDFGCGCGRVTRHLRACAPMSQWHATDIDPEAIAWARAHLPGIAWSTNGCSPPLPYPDAAFDFIYATSVFSHLDEAYQNAWLTELERVARPGALLLLTVHGESLRNALGASDRAKLRAAGVLFVQGATGRLKLDGLPDFYQCAFHTREYIERSWTAHFAIVRHLEHAIDGCQDAILLRRRAAGAA
jgi:SAM-dependent methyltransferase